MGDARQFRLDIDRFIREEVPAKVAETQRLIVAELLTLIVQATPVGNHTTWKANVARAARGKPPLPRGYVGGQARRNWQVAIGTPPRQILPGVDPSGAQALSAGYVAASRITTPTLAWISNPLAYMQPLEDGWSKQAPRGMVRQAVTVVTAKYARVR